MACEFPVAVWQSFCELLYIYFTFLGTGATSLCNSVTAKRNHWAIMDQFASSLPTSTAVVEVRFLPPFVCVSVCLSGTISQKPMQLESPKLTKKCSKMSPGISFISRSQGHKVTSHKQIASTASVVFALLWVLASSSYYNVPREHKWRSLADAIKRIFPHSSFQFPSSWWTWVNRFL